MPRTQPWRQQQQQQQHQDPQLVDVEAALAARQAPAATVNVEQRVDDTATRTASARVTQAPRETAADS